VQYVVDPVPSKHLLPIWAPGANIKSCSVLAPCPMRRRSEVGKVLVTPFFYLS